MVTSAAAPATDPRLSAAWEALREVPDPEIPAISVVDLGVIGEMWFESSEMGERLVVDLLPTFVGCPATEVMRDRVGERLRAMELADEVEVRLTFARGWSSDRISPAGREALRASGFAPPPSAVASLVELAQFPGLPSAECPYCGSRNTALENPFGPTLCRSIHHCADCRQPFEAFKPV